MDERRHRLPVKQSDDLATRQAMTKRRQDLTNRIRKKKKSQILALKRRYTTPSEETTWDNHTKNSHAGSASKNEELIVLADNIVQQASGLKLPLNHLAEFYSAISRDLRDYDLQPEHLIDSIKFIDVVSLVLLNASSELQLIAARILTNLAAVERNLDENDNYYGHVPKSWANIIIGSNALASIQKILNKGLSDVDLVTQCCWVLGNLVADSEDARDPISPFIPSLCQALMIGLEQKLPCLCRNASWVLSNLARGEKSSCNHYWGEARLSPTLIANLLMSPEKLTVAGTTASSVTWWDVAQEVMWIVAFLTAKEDSSIRILCQTQQQSVSFSSQDPVLALEAVACRTDRAIRVLSLEGKLETPESKAAFRILIPCIRAIGNVASGCDGAYIEPLLLAHSKSVAESLKALVEMGSWPCARHHSDVGTVACEGAWAARTLLCDAGLTKHISTEVALPVLLPSLCTCITSANASLELKREALSALWAAVAAPPRDNDMGSAWATRETRNEFLRQIVETPLIMRSLVDLIRSVDSDVALLALQLFDAMVRNTQDEGDIKREFEENDGVNALEHVCDIATSRNHYGSGCDWQGESNPSADIAADLIDDFFDGDDDEIEMSDTAPSYTAASFTFGMNSEVKGSSLYNQSASTTISPMGRGRGKILPAWMQQG
mmetsp:Transcript_14882/g.22723  ORF Transcript_14882/g.22723 Transcript_14882/m.22723 type:complete len:666 (+) Transcript_14882:196-2193(+)|eukprot:CAMPEP_0178909770 /NCGR_PEP_ID=MMETSP0786-20121207/8719_1 /TAXON_ID=186022 /ORGANISM="Thalassionema frauenfeldii, Strain CCMP 1798" /LENGTH=665 /DNA_ID=CAMNT_0020581933 /DNA_START=174 /DNA_END=2171 /DNA_ORIENTATION=+